MSKIGMLAELIKKQTNRQYFSDIPIGTKFIILKEEDVGDYELIGYFLSYKSQKISKGRFHFTGFIEKGSWKLIGEIKDNAELIKDYFDVNESKVERFFLSTDQSSHKYLIPLSRKDEWNKFCSLNEDDPASCDVPDWAKMIEEHLLTFENPITK